MDAFTFEISGTACWLDVEDVPRFFGRAITMDAGGYLCVSIGSKKILLHRSIMGLGRGDPRQVDHINGARSDNRKSNLRFATASQNGANKKLRPDSSSGITGVYWSAERDRWCAHIAINGRRISLGRFTNKEDAALARHVAESKYQGEFAARNGVQRGN